MVLGIVPGIRWGWSPSLAGDAEHQPGTVGDVGGAQVAAEGDGATAVVGAGEQAPDGEGGQPDRQRPAPGVVGEHHKADWLAFWPGVGVRDSGPVT